MARWRLTAGHYLNVPDIEWDYKEVDSATGRQVRKVFQVPLLLDPLNPGNSQQDFNYPGEYIVCHEGKGERRDIVFFGPPTPEMEPLDDEAKAISAVEAKNWKHNVSPGEDYGEAMIRGFQRQMDEIFAGKAVQAAGPVSAGQVSKSDFEALQEQVAALMARNAELENRSERRD